MRMKTLLLLLFTGLIATGIPLWGQPRKTGLIPTPGRLQQALHPAVMSRLNLRNEDLPQKVDLATGVILARDQGQIGSCGSFATSNSATIMIRRRDGLPISNRSWLSPSFLYNQISPNDQGSAYYDNLELAKSAGIATAISFPYTLNVNLRPGTNAFHDAARNKIAEWRMIEHDDVNTFKSFLAKGFPILVSINTYPNFNTYSGGIYVPEGSPSGRHAVVVTGYDDSAGTFIALNSWSEAWGGENGSFAFKYNTLSNRESFIIEAYILVPAAQNPETPNFPAQVEASKGTRKDVVIVRWEAVPGTLGYEIFRLDSVKPSDPREEMYVSVGMTSDTVFEDTDARQDHRYFYLVRSYTKKVSSDLSFPAEGWSSAIQNIPPGQPSGFHAVRKNASVICRWDSVDNADKYTVYAWRSSDWYKIGDTRETTFTDLKPIRNGKPPITYMVVAENSWGKSVPSNVSSVTFDDGGNDDNTDEGGEKYSGRFYSFPFKKFAEAERTFFANFVGGAAAFEENFRRGQQNFLNNFLKGGR